MNASPDDPALRLQRALLSLHGLATGDGLGEMMFGRVERAYDVIAQDQLPAGPWFHTDDTEMAISVVEVLRDFGMINQDALAQHFAERFSKSPDRGYGSGARRQLAMMLDGTDWRTASREAFSREGSLGNGNAMRVTPAGAWFADDLDRVAAEARASAMITHNAHGGGRRCHCSSRCRGNGVAAARRSLPRSDGDIFPRGPQPHARGRNAPQRIVQRPREHDELGSIGPAKRSSSGGCFHETLG